ncbi:alpha/beta hydrolase family protein [Pedobacter psychrotolerans]|uniref:Alpha/beta hydrolase family protein n=2 Tax=Pedobacter psychrotolerans TaxID=1843235 RepID=A0A4R2H6D8_9SPHI|nr:alpha/beta hydrolase family protein [Pedobacter psychrotolerans]
MPTISFVKLHGKSISNMIKYFFIVILLFQTITALAQVKTAKDINYAHNTKEQNSLNVFYKADHVENKPVLIFIHGGSWSSGKKETYWWLGRNFARKGIVTVIINYPLAPDVQYEKMADDCALAVKWVKENISTYKASPGKIFIMGHSAGAHLAELINADPKYFDHAKIKNPIKGVILNDPFGLDLHEYLTTAKKDSFYFDFIRTFTDKPEVWKVASPLNYVNNIKNPHLLFYGSKTYEAIKLQTPRLYQKLKANHIPVEIKEIEGKSHVPMISQMIWGGNDLYEEIVGFMQKTISGK